VPELQGTWRAEDGSHGTFEGLKVPSSVAGNAWKRVAVWFSSLGEIKCFHVVAVGFHPWGKSLSQFLFG